MKYKYYKKEGIYEDKPNGGLQFLYNNWFGRFILLLITNKFVSNLVGFHMNSPFSKPMIKKYIKKYNIDMNLYKKKHYDNFNDFFKRELIEINKTEDPNDLISICDSKISVYPISNDLILNIKNSKYNLKELIKDELSPEYQGGTCIIYRLEPKDYHHYIFNDDGIILSNKKINGKLHTVNPIVYEKYQVFTENKREVSVLKMSHLDNVIQIEVGALCVGRIKNNELTQFERYDEKGYFEFGGSTIIQLFKKDVIAVDEEIINNTNNEIETQVTVGTVIGRVIK
jgi:phosphatidylserine decarboxylase